MLQIFVMFGLVLRQLAKEWSQRLSVAGGGRVRIE